MVIRMTLWNWTNRTRQNLPELRYYAGIRCNQSSAQMLVSAHLGTYLTLNKHGTNFSIDKVLV